MCTELGIKKTHSNDTYSIHYAMPLRNMLYDAMDCTDQIKIEGDTKISVDERLSGMRKDAKLLPALTQLSQHRSIARYVTTH